MSFRSSLVRLSNLSACAGEIAVRYPAISSQQPHADVSASVPVGSAGDGSVVGSSDQAHERECEREQEQAMACESRRQLPMRENWEETLDAR